MSTWSTSAWGSGALIIIALALWVAALDALIYFADRSGRDGDPARFMIDQEARELRVR